MAHVWGTGTEPALQLPNIVVDIPCERMFPADPSSAPASLYDHNRSKPNAMEYRHEPDVEHPRQTPAPSFASGSRTFTPSTSTTSSQSRNTNGPTRRVQSSYSRPEAFAHNSGTYRHSDTSPSEPELQYRARAVPPGHRESTNQQPRFGHRTTSRHRAEDVRRRARISGRIDGASPAADQITSKLWAASRHESPALVEGALDDDEYVNRERQDPLECIANLSPYEDVIRHVETRFEDGSVGAPSCAPYSHSPEEFQNMIRPHEPDGLEKNTRHILPVSSPITVSHPSSSASTPEVQSARGPGRPVRGRYEISNDSAASSGGLSRSQSGDPDSPLHILVIQNHRTAIPRSISMEELRIGRIELRFEARGIPNLDLASLSDPFIRVQARDPVEGIIFDKRSEVVFDDLEPRWVIPIVFMYHPRLRITLIIDMYDCDSVNEDAPISKHDYIGWAAVDLNSLLCRRGGRTVTALQNRSKTGLKHLKGKDTRNFYATSENCCACGRPFDQLAKFCPACHSSGPTRRRWSQNGHRGDISVFAEPVREPESGAEGVAGVRGCGQCAGIVGFEDSIVSQAYPSLASGEGIMTEGNSPMCNCVVGGSSPRSNSTARSAASGGDPNGRIFPGIVKLRLNCSALRKPKREGSGICMQFFELQRERKELGGTTAWTVVYRSEDGYEVNEKGYFEYEIATLHETVVHNGDPNRKLRFVFYERFARKAHHPMCYVETTMKELVQLRRGFHWSSSLVATPESRRAGATAGTVSVESVIPDKRKADTINVEMEVELDHVQGRSSLVDDPPKARLRIGGGLLGRIRQEIQLH